MNKKTRFARFWNSGLLYDLFSDKERTHTRKISPKLGVLGFLGFLGFAGFIPGILHIEEILTVPGFFFFFCFFGFFGFYYEGKMSDTLIDERYQANACRAKAIANQTGFTLVFLITILTMSWLRLDTYDMLSVLIATLGLTFGLTVFLQQYLLYRFESR